MLIVGVQYEPAFSICLGFTQTIVNMQNNKTRFLTRFWPFITYFGSKSGVRSQLLPPNSLQRNRYLSRILEKYGSTKGSDVAGSTTKLCAVTRKLHVWPQVAWFWSRTPICTCTFVADVHPHTEKSIFLFTALKFSCPWGPL